MDRDFLIDLFADFGPVTIRPMFSGFGISADGTNFAMALRAGLYFRADEQSIPQFKAEGSKPFQYQTRARTVTVELILAIAGAAVRRFRGVGGLGEGGAGSRAARGVAQASEARGGKAPAKKAWLKSLRRTSLKAEKVVILRCRRKLATASKDGRGTAASHPSRPAKSARASG